MNKTVGLVTSDFCDMFVNAQKNFFLAGEIAYFNIYLDNSKCRNPCTLEVSHKTKIKCNQESTRYSKTITNRSEVFNGATSKEAPKNFFIAFQIGNKLKNPHKSIAHPDNYLMLANMIPESIEATTFSVTNYLEFYIRHSSTTFSDQSKYNFHF